MPDDPNSLTLSATCQETGCATEWTDLVEEHGIVSRYCRGHAGNAVARGGMAAGGVVASSARNHLGPCCIVSKRVVDKWMAERPFGGSTQEPITVSIDGSGRPATRSDTIPAHAPPPRRHVD